DVTIELDGVDPHPVADRPSRRGIASLVLEDEQLPVTKLRCHIPVVGKPLSRRPDEGVRECLSNADRYPRIHGALGETTGHILTLGEAPESRQELGPRPHRPASTVLFPVFANRLDL